MTNVSKTHERVLIGWREWCGLNDLGIPLIKAKIDTGARTSAIHAFDIKPIMKGRRLWVRFSIHPIQGDTSRVTHCLAPVIDQRAVMSSNGHKEHRYVIETHLSIGDQSWPIELTLSNRDPLRFRLLLGRAALQGRVCIDPLYSYHQGRFSKRQQARYYHE
jgi:ribosomal protein S6--L-glutamate ligase